MRGPSLAYFDELGRGTSTHDGAAIAVATLDHVASGPRTLSLFTTHHPTVAELARVRPADIALRHMAVVGEELLFRLAHDAGPGSLGVRAAAAAGLPPSLLQDARARSQMLRTRATRQAEAARDLRLAALLLGEAGGEAGGDGGGEGGAECEGGAEAEAEVGPPAWTALQQRIVAARARGLAP